MKIFCILNMITLAIVLGGNFDLSDLLYFGRVGKNVWECLAGIFMKRKTGAPGINGGLQTIEDISHLIGRLR